MTVELTFSLNQLCRDYLSIISSQQNKPDTALIHAETAKQELLISL